MYKKWSFLAPFCIWGCLLQGVAAQTYTLSGNTYNERSQSLVNCMVNSVNPYVSGAGIKYTSAFYWARIYAGVDAGNAATQLESLVDNLLAGAETLQASGSSDIEFDCHMLIHGYLLCKDKISSQLQGKIKAFLHTTNFNSGGSTGTLNLDMMRYTTGLMAALEWSDFTDRNGKTASQIVSYNRPRILNVLNNIFHNNCSEMDAFVYLPTDMMYLRMLAEFCSDAEIRQKAYVCYQQMIASMAGAWNQGLYVANPPRSKGWDQLCAGMLAPNSRATALAWLFFGNYCNEFQMTGQCTSDSGNFAIFCFWSAYQRSIFPMHEILLAENRKSFPYEYRSFIDNQTVKSSNNTIVSNWKYYKYTYQSKHYGLATQTEIPYNLTNALTLQTYKETKRTYLAWQDDASNQCFFTVCQDNPAEPTDVVNANAVGYGENPFQRVLQYKGAAIGITNVPVTYLNNNRYQLYVPFTRYIKQRMVSDNWVFCHTGSMMFAFRTVEPFTLMTSRMPYTVPDCDLLMFTDQTTHKGSWILQTTEITPDLKGNSLAEELNNFKNKLLATASFDTVNYASDTPCLRYTSMDGDVIDLTFFPPTAAYSGQYKINGTVQTLGDGNLFSSDYAGQADSSDNVYIYATEGTPTVLSWSSPVASDNMEVVNGGRGLETSTGLLPVREDRQSIRCYNAGNRLIICDIPVGGEVSFAICTVAGVVVQKGVGQVTDGRMELIVGDIPRGLYIVNIKSASGSRTGKWIRQ
jgi:hypothetical protein